MRVLEGVLSESQGYYLGIKKKIELKIRNLPKGSIKERRISGRRYYYLQFRQGKKVIQKYLGKIKPEAIIKQIKYRSLLKSELKKVNQALKVIKRSRRQ